MHSQHRSRESIRALSARWSRAGAALPLLALCRCVGTVDATSADHSADAADDLAAVVVRRDAASASALLDAGDAGAYAVSGDGAAGDGAVDGTFAVEVSGDGAGGDGFVGWATVDGASGDGGVDGASGDATVDAGKPCDATATPKDNACVLDSAYGVFVAETLGNPGFVSEAGATEAGTDGGHATAPSTPDGSPTNPFWSIEEAMAHLGRRLRIYVCDGTYREQVTITTPVSLYRGLSCTGGVWRWDGGTTQVLSPTSNYALSIAGLNTAAIDVQDFAFAAADATSPGASSVAAIIAASTVTLTRVVLTAGRGAKGTDGVTNGYNYSVDSIVSMAPSSGQMGGTSSCVNGTTSAGGSGGMICTDTCSGTGDGAPGTASPMPSVSSGLDGAGGPYANAQGPLPGDPGANGQPVPPSAQVKVLGTLSATTWFPSQGADAEAGNPGQGGGGGAAITCPGPPGPGQSPTSPGGGGGAGGCGGAGGLGGKGGGGSIALVSINNSSAIALVSSSLTAGQGGDGGRGGAGQDGQNGGVGYASVNPLAGSCIGYPDNYYAGVGAAGGNGGNGAGGSGGGGGTGGISVGVLYRGARPVADVSTGVTPGTAGNPGIGGLPGSQMLPTVGNPGSPGLDGISAAYLGPI